MLLEKKVSISQPFPLRSIERNINNRVKSVAQAWTALESGYSRDLASKDRHGGRSGENSDGTGHDVGGRTGENSTDQCD